MPLLCSILFSGSHAPQSKNEGSFPWCPHVLPSPHFPLPSSFSLPHSLPPVTLASFSNTSDKCASAFPSLSFLYLKCSSSNINMAPCFSLYSKLTFSVRPPLVTLSKTSTVSVSSISSFLIYFFSIVHPSL